ncbi:MAG: GntR family transcriptional regulator [Kordiimonadaceae bacterium]|jgi:GntR family transcriptional regulator|nr:GntR family transcriptional regulator [Kordiimonadaceae bacterium]MBT6035683.1 GntR family transcriptional regulator [Kordiimonadaceae bacterium]MBT6329769.1 GntR family transcriptional regulator [Kordiimonadaceae bacterium]MBT7583352.1 GntR family transcriptional regulator [Kordiimonadaceae bacterium]
MEIVINIDDETPLFSQLMEQIKKAVQSGNLSAGDSLPSIRQLANDLDLNNKTVAKAYRLLERDEVIVTRGYRGTFIHEQAKKNSDRDLNAWVALELTKTIDTLKHAGAMDSEIRIAFAEAMKKER